MSYERHDRRLFSIRIVWIAFFVLFVSINIAAQVAYYHQTQPISLPEEKLQALSEMGFSQKSYGIFLFLLQFPIPVTWSGLGLLIFIRKSSDNSARIISLLMVGLSTLASIPLWEAFATSYPQWKGLVLPMAFLGNICLWTFFFVFPTGRFVPRWTVFLAIFLSLYNILNSYEFALPPAGVALGKSLDFIFPLFFILFLVSIIGIPLYRFKYVSSPIERIQLRWVVFTIVVAMMIFALTASTVFLLPNSNPELDFSFVTKVVQPLGWTIPIILIPISITISILRFHLFDIDYLIRRTLLYALLTGLLGLVYFGGVALLQSILTAGRASQDAANGQPSALVIVLTTLAIAALANPLRKRLQDFIDRRFYRQKYDAEKALADFASTARNETDLPALTGSLVNVIQNTVQPDHVNLWLKSTRL